MRSALLKGVKPTPVSIPLFNDLTAAPVDKLTVTR